MTPTPSPQPAQDPLDRKLHGIAVYNPDLLSEDELKAVFVARGELLRRLVEDLSCERPSHRLIIGVRGMGKTTLLRRLRYAIDDDARLSHRWLPLVFPEEQYNVTRLSDFYLNCLDALCDILEQRADTTHLAEIEEFIEQIETLPPADVARQAQRGLRDAAVKLERGFVLLVDNVERILDDLHDAEQWAFREFLSDDDHFVLIGASAQPIESNYNHGKPFYDFFGVHELKGLSADETEQVLRTLSHIAGDTQIPKWLADDPARLKTLNVLSGGNPRTVVLLFHLLAQGTEGDVLSDLERLLDLCTPLYKARIDELPPQAQQVLDALAVIWEPTTAAVVATHARLEVETVSSQLTRLVKQGIVERVALPPGKKMGYQVAERFFNIWYLMRASRRVRRKLLWLVQFLKLFYSETERQDRVDRILGNGAGGERSQRWVEAEASYWKAIESDPHSSDPWNNLGVLQRSLCRDVEAETSFRKAIELDPKNTLPWHNLAVQFTDLGRNTEAIEFARTAVGLEPTNGHFQCALALALCRTASAEAIVHAREAYRLDPSQSWIAHHSAAILAHFGQWHEAAVIAQRSLPTQSASDWNVFAPTHHTFFHDAVQTGHAADAVELLIQSGRADEWRPLVEALRTVVDGTTDRLARLAPEVRTPATKLFEQLTQPAPA